MAVPKKKTSRSRRNMRRSHDAIKFTSVIQACPSCGELHLRHRICEGCGTYRGRQVFEVADAE